MERCIGHFVQVGRSSSSLERCGELAWLWEGMEGRGRSCWHRAQKSLHEPEDDHKRLKPTAELNWGFENGSKRRWRNRQKQDFVGQGREFRFCHKAIQPLKCLSKEGKHNLCCVLRKPCFLFCRNEQGRRNLRSGSTKRRLVSLLR